MLFRYATAVLLGTVATFGLLMLMRSVIADPMPAADSGIKGALLTWARLVEEREPQINDRPQKPIPPVEPPRDPPLITWRTIGTTGTELGVKPPLVAIEGPGVGQFVSDGTYLPIVRVSPVYPRRALTRNIEGYVLVEFVVTETGSVRDPVVLVAEPPGFFERSALSAVVKFKYKPMVVNGAAVAVPGVRNRVVFEMED